MIGVINFRGKSYLKDPPPLNYAQLALRITISEFRIISMEKLYDYENHLKRLILMRGSLCDGLKVFIGSIFKIRHLAYYD